MKQPRRGLLLLLCGLLVWFLAESRLLRAWAVEALSLCAASVVPALFPFLSVSSLLISLGFGEWVAPHLAGLMTPLFRLPGCASSALLLGLVGGYPVGARTAAGLYSQGLLTKEEAERLLAFCSNSNPVFLITVLGQGVFGSFRAGLWLWLIHVLSALLAGLMFRGGGGRRGKAPEAVCCKAVSLPGAFVAAVRESAAAMVSVCGFVVFFYVLSRPLASLVGPWGAAAVGALELFSLTPLLRPDRAGFLLAAACTGFGGLSVLCQTAVVTEGLSLKYHLRGKAAQGALSALLAALVWPML